MQFNAFELVVFRKIRPVCDLHVIENSLGYLGTDSRVHRTLEGLESAG